MCTQRRPGGNAENAVPETDPGPAHVNLDGMQLPLADRDFDDKVAAYLHSSFAPSLDAVFENLSLEVESQTLGEYGSRIERHLFPALVTAKCYDAVSAHFLEYCCHFVKGYSIPILLLNKWLDTSAAVDKTQLCKSFGFFYGVQDSLISLPRGANIARHLNRVYGLVTDSLLREMKNRYRIPPFDAETSFRASYYRSVCGYLSAIVGGTLELLGVEISSDLKHLLYLFGVLRQICDELCDLREDLEQGIVTLPVLYVLSERDIRSELLLFWDSRLDFESLESIIAHAGGYETCYQKGVSVYRECLAIKVSIQAEYPFLENLFLFYDWRMSFLDRLKRDGWVDNYVY